MKTCTMCSQPKPFSEFNKSTRDGYQSRCRECNSAYLKQHYKENRQYYKDKATKLLVWKREQIASLKSVPCADCGNTYPAYAMDFDHLGDKEFNINEFGKYPWPKVLDEIKKCEVVCAICHRIRTHDRMEGQAK